MITLVDKIRCFFGGLKVSPIHKVVKHSFFREDTIRDKLYSEGYVIADFLSSTELSLIRKSYEENCNERQNDSGVFFGEISTEIHRRNVAILAEKFNHWFINYKLMVSAFVVKLPGISSKVPIHQDTASVDETKYSSINIWVPLEDVDESNGALYIIPKSHHVFMPYRCATLDPITKNIEPLLEPYFIPVNLKAGEAILFDSRLFHYSPPNLSGNPRVALVTKVCPEEASIIAYFCDCELDKTRIEMWKCNDDYLRHPENHNDTIRPRNCTLVDIKKCDVLPLTATDFEQAMHKYKIGC